MWVISSPKRREGQILQAQIARGWIDEELGNHGVEADRENRQSMAGEDDVVIFGVVGDLGDAGIG